MMVIVIVSVDIVIPENFIATLYIRGMSILITPDLEGFAYTSALIPLLHLKQGMPHTKALTHQNDGNAGIQYLKLQGTRSGPVYEGMPLLVFVVNKAVVVP